MSKENEQSFILIYSNDTFDVYYDKDTKRYHIDVFNDGHFWDEVWFDEYREEECKSMQAALNDRPDITLFNTSYNTEDCTFEQIKTAIDDFNKMTADLAKSDKEMYEEQAIKMLTNWDKD